VNVAVNFDLPVHPAANIFPMMDEKRLSELALDIQENGQQVPIRLLAGEIIDGRNRLAACKIAKVQPIIEHLPDGANPWQVAWTLNGQRRDLNDAQRYLLWADCSKGDDAWQAEQRRAQEEKRRKQSDAAKAQHELSNPRAGEAMQDFGSGTKSSTTKTEVEKEEPNRARDKKAEAAGVSIKTVMLADTLANKRPDLIAQVKAGETTLSKAYTQAKKDENFAKLTDISAQEVKAAQGVYDVIVIDPPWQMEKIERDVRPNQTAFDYPTMSEAELAQMTLPVARDAHVFVWTTHKFLPMALRLMDVWGVRYVCTMVWHKPGGFQPIGLPQYNCEFALYGRVGSPGFIDTKAFPVCFEAPRGAHSEKPQEFYDLLNRVTAGRRLDMFNRRQIEGFDGWGNESA
jgi:N6-adenosine-specific RNA methylase IME4